jgi:hypothetical protein
MARRTSGWLWGLALVLALAVGIARVTMGEADILATPDLAGAVPNLAHVPVPPGDMAVAGDPTISVSTIASVLRAYGSPAAADAQDLYDLGVRYHIDPAFALAFFIQESACGTTGVASVTHSLGNIRYTLSDSPVSYTDYDGYRAYATWRDGFEDWYWLIDQVYLPQGLTTVERIVPVYAPADDNNDPTAYIAHVKQLVAYWRSH